MDVKGQTRGTKKANNTGTAPSKWETTFTVGEVTDNGPKHEEKHIDKTQHKKTEKLANKKHTVRQTKQVIRKVGVTNQQKRQKTPS